MKGLEIAETSGGAAFGVRVSPGARRNAVEGVYGGALKVKLTAPPVDGKANEALVELLASVLGVARSAVVISSGTTGRSKRVRVRGLAAAETERRLEAAAGN